MIVLNSTKENYKKFRKNLIKWLFSIDKMLFDEYNISRVYWEKVYL